MFAGPAFFLDLRHKGAKKKKGAKKLFILLFLLSAFA
jgi:hypothetical protein